MIQLDIFSQTTFLIIICFSFLIFIFTISMNKKNSLLKVFGTAFFIPLCLCNYFLLFIKGVPYVYIFWLSEIYLSVTFFILLLFEFKVKSYRLVAFSIFTISLFSCVILKNFNILLFYSLSYRNKVLISLYVVFMNIILLNYKKLLKTYFGYANIFLFISIILSFFQGQEYILYVSLISKFLAYLSFYMYFYKSTYAMLMNKIKEADKIRKRLDISINKEVKKQLLHYEIAKEKLLMKSKTDSFTKTYNKETIITMIHELIELEENEQFSILMLDIDNFKGINDKYGHITGDLCIKNLVNTLRNNISKIDILGRYGGDEFIIILPLLDIEEARLVAEKIRENVSKMSEPKFTISIGISNYPRDGNTVKDLISLADKGLYSSKHRGKNTVSHPELSL